MQCGRFEICKECETGIEYQPPEPDKQEHEQEQTWCVVVTVNNINTLETQNL